ncbi:MAG: hypothetical protein N2690_01735 [Rhodocyclaceae bacterium]|jgi:protocatechuate 3,4-dioxygenase beta subunit|nr:hypothetical protein [Rhodocyclaceae bacterium]
MRLPEPYRCALIAAAGAGAQVIDRIVDEARCAHPELFVSAEEDRLRLIAREALERYASHASDMSDFEARCADMRTILAALRRGLSLERQR